MRHFLRPTIPKIAAYLLFFFIMPTYYYVCTEEICSLRFSFLVITHILYNKEFGMLTFPGLLLLMITSYLIACILVSIATPFFEMRGKK